MVMDQSTVIDLHCDLEVQYVIEVQRSDGALLVRPEVDHGATSLDDILACHGERRLTRDAISALLRELPIDREG